MDLRRVRERARAVHQNRLDPRHSRQQVANAIALGLTNARLEGMNSTVPLLSHRARGFRRLDSLLAMITLVCGRIPVALPT